MIVADIITGIFSPIVSTVNKWQDNRAKKAERRDRIEEAKTVAEETRLTTQVHHQGEYDTEAQRQMQYSWKDEYLLVVLTLPFIGSFIPVVQDYIITGWEYVSKAPEWYQAAFIGVTIATFGLRWAAKKMMK